MAHELQDRLMSMGPEQAQAFHDILHIYEELADQYGLWDAASIMMEWCSDDGFIDFRAWLIAQGREVYLAALKDPDSLADVEPYGNCCFESLTYVGDAAYRQLTGENINENADPAANVMVTWLPNNKRLDSLTFRKELYELIGELQNGEMLGSLPAMISFCKTHPEARMSDRQTFFH